MRGFNEQYGKVIKRKASPGTDGGAMLADLLEADADKKGPLSDSEIEKEIFSAPVFAGKRSLAQVRAFQSGAVDPTEAALALRRGFFPIIDGDNFFWSDREDGKSEIGSNPYRFHKFPARYSTREEGDASWIDKEWVIDSVLSRSLGEGPARVPIRAEGSPRGARYEWWLAGHLVGYFEKGMYHDALSGQSVEGEEPDENTPWPMENPIVTSMSHVARSRSRVELTYQLSESQRNPEEMEEIIEKIAGDLGKHKEEVRKDFWSLVRSGFFVEKKQGLSRKSVFRIRQDKKEKRNDWENDDDRSRKEFEWNTGISLKIEDEVIDNIRKFWDSPNKKTVDKIIKDTKERLKQERVDQK
jgi:hypothetical protein